MSRDSAFRRFLAGLKQPMGFNADGRPIGAGLTAALRTQRDDQPPVAEYAERPSDQQLFSR
ncbi:hypothetical protein [Catenuloplanes japonicus]|uniref:hypothetical protein n=1 Tax=Catenuloplanes japonicus TaxID=33876 RepID=UPI0005257100|nr:hypothetical protein [Catenuloplanes japonicus]